MPFSKSQQIFPRLHSLPACRSEQQKRYMLCIHYITQAKMWPKTAVLSDFHKFQVFNVEINKEAHSEPKPNFLSEVS